MKNIIYFVYFNNVIFLSHVSLWQSGFINVLLLILILVLFLYQRRHPQPHIHAHSVSHWKLGQTRLGVGTRSDKKRMECQWKETKEGVRKIFIILITCSVCLSAKNLHFPQFLTWRWQFSLASGTHIYPESRCGIRARKTGNMLA